MCNIPLVSFPVLIRQLSLLAVWITWIVPVSNGSGGGGLGMRLANHSLFPGQSNWLIRTYSMHTACNLSKAAGWSFKITKSLGTQLASKPYRTHGMLWPRSAAFFGCQGNGVCQRLLFCRAFFLHSWWRPAATASADSQRVPNTRSARWSTHLSMLSQYAPPTMENFQDMLFCYEPKNK